MTEPKQTRYELDRIAEREAFANFSSTAPTRAGDWMSCSCPSCGRLFAYQWPDADSPAARFMCHFGQAPHVVCAYLCDDALPRDLSDFAVTAIGEPVDLDATAKCSCGATWAFDGVALGCPACGAYGFLRTFLADGCAHVIEEAQASHGDRAVLASCLQDLVAFFDGVMRAQLLLVDRNHRVALVKYEAQPDGPPPALNPFPTKRSFQNLKNARTALLPEHDLAATVPDDEWRRTERAFQRRHLFAHALGVVDQDYLDKTSDTDAVLGKQVPLNVNDIVVSAESLRSAGTNFFGCWLS